MEQAKADAGDLVCIQCVDDGEEEHVIEVAFEEPQRKSYWDDLSGEMSCQATPGIYASPHASFDWIDI